MQAKSKFKAPSEKAVRDLLERYACPEPYHAVRTRFLGMIATPFDRVSPLQAIKDLWGGELPPRVLTKDSPENLDFCGEVFEFVVEMMV